jgi:hypothetical protein
MKVCYLSLCGPCLFPFLPKVYCQLNFCIVELKSLKKNLFIRFAFGLGRRRAGEGLPASQLPPLPERSSTQKLPQEQVSSPASPEIEDFRHSSGYLYPAIEIFKTKEETYAQWFRRESNVGEVPELAVQKASRMMQQGTDIPLSPATHLGSSRK